MRGLLAFASAAVLLASAQAQTAIQWDHVAPMASTRSSHTATLLNNGDVLVAGGSLHSAETYNLDRNEWSPAGNMSTSRRYHTATRLVDGSVLVAGGIENGFASSGSADIYTPGASWTPAAEMSFSRKFHTATLLDNGTVLVVGGMNDSSAGTNTAEIYTPSTDSWRLTSSNMSVKRDRHTATHIRQDGKSYVLVAGGRQNGGALQTAELYDASADTWTPTDSPMNVARTNHTATLLPDGRVLVVGGYNITGSSGSFVTTVLDSAEIYDPSDKSWTLVSDTMDTPRNNHAATPLPDGTVLVTGGASVGNLHVNSAEIFDPQSHTWTAAPSMNIERAYHTATVIHGDRVLVAGGNALSSERLDSAESWLSPPPPILMTPMGNPSVPVPVPALGASALAALALLLAACVAHPRRQWLG